MTEALKPCPFCGAAAFVTHRDTIACDQCGGEMITGEDCTLEETIAAWNRRVRPTPSAEGEVEKLIERLYGARIRFGAPGWPDKHLQFIFDVLGEAITTVTTLKAERDEARELMAK